MTRRPREVIAVMLARAADRVLAPGVTSPAGPQVPVTVAYPVSPFWHYSVCGRCGEQTRPGLPCETCGWLLGVMTPARASACGVCLDDAEEPVTAGRWRAGTAAAG